MRFQGGAVTGRGARDLSCSEGTGSRSVCLSWDPGPAGPAGPTRGKPLPSLSSTPQPSPRKEGSGLEPRFPMEVGGGPHCHLLCSEHSCPLIPAVPFRTGLGAPRPDPLASGPAWKNLPSDSAGPGPAGSLGNVWGSGEELMNIYSPCWKWGGAEPSGGCPCPPGSGHPEPTVAQG